MVAFLAGAFSHHRLCNFEGDTVGQEAAFRGEFELIARGVEPAAIYEVGDFDVVEFGPEQVFYAGAGEAVCGAQPHREKFVGRVLIGQGAYGLRRACDIVGRAVLGFCREALTVFCQSSMCARANAEPVAGAPIDLIVDRAVAFAFRVVGNFISG